MSGEPPNAPFSDYHGFVNFPHDWRHGGEEWRDPGYPPDRPLPDPANSRLYILFWVMIAVVVLAATAFGMALEALLVLT